MRKRAQLSKAELRAAEVALEKIPASGQAVRGVLLYPNLYEVGMSNLAVHCLLQALNRDGLACERAFVPPIDELTRLQAARHSLTSFDTDTPLGGFDFVAITCSYELDYLNIPRMLSLGGIEPLADQRSEDAPLVLMGGPAVTANPEPVAAFADAIAIGEVEPIERQLREILQGLGKRGAGKSTVLAELAALPGLYVPSFVPPDEVPPPIQRLYAENLDESMTSSVILTPHTEFADRFLAEVGRG